jgi:hypothetical protein
MWRSCHHFIPALVVVLCAAALTQGCSGIPKLHSQFGAVAGHNYGDEAPGGSNQGQFVAELGYVAGESETNPDKWDFGATSYLMLADPMRPGIKAVARRRFNKDLDLDFSAGPMITYDSSGLFNGFIGGVALNWHFVTLRSEFMSWPVEPWEQGLSDENQVNYTVHHPGGHEMMWWNGVSLSGTASWVTAGALLAVIIWAGANGAFE